MLFSACSLALVVPVAVLGASSDAPMSLSSSRGHRKFFGQQQHGSRNATRGAGRSWSSRSSNGGKGVEENSMSKPATPVLSARSGFPTVAEGLQAFASSALAEMGKQNGGSMGDFSFSTAWKEDCAQPTGGAKGGQGSGGTVWETEWATTWTTEWVGGGGSSAAATTTPVVIQTTKAATTTQAAPTSVAVSASAGASASSGSSSSSGSDSSIETVALQKHNDLRAKHSAPALTWNSTLAQTAEAWAKKCTFKHGGGVALGSGENLSVYAGTGGMDLDLGIGMKNTSQLGCADVSCVPTYNEDGSVLYETGGRMLVCHYLAAGNVRGQFASNVLSS
ncbi:hypothetical protein JCM8547_004936 [Rhodosporidiobolus lusitaniae]